MLRFTSYIFIVFFAIIIVQVYPKEINFNQHDYEITFERAELGRYNKDYVHYLKVNTFKYNRTCTAFNISYNYKENIGQDLEVILQVYKFASNEYRTFPIRFELRFCSIFEKHIAGVDIDSLKCGNIKSCIVEKNKEYQICNFTPDQSKFPPYIPNGRYMLEMYAMYHSVEIWILRGYAEVTRPLIRK